MASLCNQCKRAVGETDTVCPHCGAALPSGPESAGLGTSVSDLLDSMLRAKDPPPQAESAPRFSALSPVPAKGENDIFRPDFGIGESSLSSAGETGGSLEGDSDLPEETAAPSGIDGIDGDPPLSSEKSRALESSFDAYPLESHRNQNSPVLMVVVVLSVLALFAVAFTKIAMPLMERNRQQSEALGYLSGAWISDEFAFVDSTEKNFVEVLTIEDDSSYRMVYAVHDPDNPDGWMNGEWTIEYEISGTVIFKEETSQLLLLYDEGENHYAFTRVIVVREEDEMRLREYYDESKSSFYDVTLHRIQLPEEAAA